MKRTITSSALALGLLCGAASAETLLLGDPAISEDRIAFTYAGDIWLADRDGTNPRRLTSGQASETNPVFSPDGSQIAFNAAYENNLDVYIVDADGGQPKRLTYHPSADHVRGWTPDGSVVTFSSGRMANDNRATNQLYHVSIEGGLPTRQMAARFFQGQYDENGEQLAYIAHDPAYSGLFGGAAGWGGYRGGTAPSINILSVGGDDWATIPGDRVTDIYPMWHGDDVVFLSDRGDEERFNLYRYSEGQDVERLTDEEDWDIFSASLHGDTVIYEVGGRLKLYDLESGETTPLSITIKTDLPQAQPGMRDAAGMITDASLSPTGKRAVLTARGDVFTVPLDEGSPRILTPEGGDRAYTAMWSPDGQRITYVHDDGENQRLIIRPQVYDGEAERAKITDGMKFISSLLKGDPSEVKTFELGEGFNFILGWTPNGKTIVFEDNGLNLNVIDTESGQVRTLTTAARREGYGVAISPDGRWLAATVEQPNFMRDLVLFDLNSNGRSSFTVSDGIADVGSPAFSPDGKYLYFTASVNSGPAQVGLDLSSQEQNYRAGIYVAVLNDEDRLPNADEKGDEPYSGEEEKSEEEEKEEQEKANENAKVELDRDGLVRRIVGLPVPEAAYRSLEVAANGDVLYLMQEQPGATTPPPGTPYGANNALMRYSMKDKAASSVMDGVASFTISNDRKTVLASKGNGQLLTLPAEAGGEPKPVDTSGLKVMIDPREEWQQIFNDVHRMEEAYFYAPNMHGLDWDAVREKYEPLLEHVGRRADLNKVLVQMIAEMQVGHNNVGGGDGYSDKGPGVGLLGADIAFENGAHRIKRIYTGELWNPFIEAPLAEPGLDIEEGDYILTVNGQPLGENDNIFQYLQGTTGKQIALGVADSASGSGLRVVTVKPTGSEFFTRLWSWIEDNRRTVDEQSDGKVGYVYMRDTTTTGYRMFNRMFFPQTDKEALIIDERGNNGGQAANYVTDVLKRSYLASWKDRQGEMWQTPGGAHYGPKVMLIDQDAGSGGDFLPYAFREEELGPLIGTRTWGGLIGIYANPNLIDGGFLTVPNFRFIDADDEWTIENEGVAPDIRVELNPVIANEGRDSQLEAGIEEAMKRIGSTESPVPDEAPAYPTELGQ
jgi:tricorn protease